MTEETKIETKVEAPAAPKEKKPRKAAAPKAKEVKSEATVPEAKAEVKAEAKVEVKTEAKAEVKKSRRKSVSTKGNKAIVVRGKRKESIARATIKKGNGTVRVNKINVEALNNKYIRFFITEPLRFLGPEANTVSISVTVNGGGMLGQAQAARTAIANAIVEYFDDKALKDRIMAADKFMLVEDSRRVEPKKYKGPKARARFQKSYR
jgi:small subunit ribosomal protein S9